MSAQAQEKNPSRRWEAQVPHHYVGTALKLPPRIFVFFAKMTQSITLLFIGMGGSTLFSILPPKNVKERVGVWRGACSGGVAPGTIMQ